MSYIINMRPNSGQKAKNRQVDTKFNIHRTPAAVQGPWFKLINYLELLNTLTQFEELSDYLSASDIKAIAVTVGQKKGTIAEEKSSVEDLLNNITKMVDRLKDTLPESAKTDIICKKKIAITTQIKTLQDTLPSDTLERQLCSFKKVTTTKKTVCHTKIIVEIETETPDSWED